MQLLFVKLFKIANKGFYSFVTFLRKIELNQKENIKLYFIACQKEILFSGGLFWEKPVNG
jgi:hypothetical protein